jgi:hypothetical protein
MIRKEIAIEKTKPKKKYKYWKSQSGSELSNKSKSGMFNTSSINIERITSFCSCLFSENDLLYSEILFGTL